MVDYQYINVFAKSMMLKYDAHKRRETQADKIHHGIILYALWNKDNRRQGNDNPTKQMKNN